MYIIVAIIFIFCNILFSYEYTDEFYIKSNYEYIYNRLDKREKPIGKLNKDCKIQILEERGNYKKVRVEGWVLKFSIDKKRVLKRNYQIVGNKIRKVENKMIKIPAGYFYYGTKNLVENSIYKKIYLKSFYIDKYEITNYEFEKVINRGLRRSKYSACDNCPAINITFLEAYNYCKKVNKRLCTKEEWEKVAKGKHNYKYVYGNKYIKGACNSDNLEELGAYPVGSFKDCKNEYNVYDMTGNVAEWTLSKADKDGRYRIYKGGSWFSSPSESYSFINNFDTDTTTYDIIGFRCCKDSENK